MAQGSLLQGLEKLANRVRQLEREKREAVAKVEALERDQRQAAATIEALKRAESEAAVRIQELEQEKKQATVTIGALEREVGELGALIALASAKVDEIIREGASPEASRRVAVRAPEEPKSLGHPGELAVAPQEPPSKAWRFD